MQSNQRSFVQENWIPVVALVGLILAGVLRLSGADARLVDLPLILVSVIGGIPLLWQTTRALKAGKFNVDIIAILSIGGGLAIHEYLPAAIIVFMLSSGEALEAYALRRASGSLETLLKQRPRTANRWDGKEFVPTPIDQVKVGDRLLIKPGESVPVDAEIVKGSSEFDEALLTGESVPVAHRIGDRLLSGVANVTSPVETTALVLADESTYAKIVKLVKEAEGKKGTTQRLADQFGAYFTPITLVIVAATWFFTRDVVTSYSVLVIATPCPLLLATPIAFIAGIGRAAKLGIIVKSGLGLEGLSRSRSILFDKTGTLTAGSLDIKEILIHESTQTKRSVLALAASLEQYSNHVVARSIVVHAKHLGLKLAEATKVEEVAGKGLRGSLEGRSVIIGNATILTDAKISLKDHHARQSGELILEVAIGRKHVASIVLADTVRPESRQVIQSLRNRYGFSTIAMLTGDRREVAERIASDVGIIDVRAELLPQDKLVAVEESVKEAHAHQQTVIMVGDGINDAPALERADIGVAIGKQGGEVAVEAADVVLLGDKLDKLTDAVRIGRASVSIATQGIWIGMGLSFVGMIAAAFGYIPPVAGAVGQEAIDVLVILNALRVLRV